MREIKFRAWDKKENVMRGVHALFGNGHVYVYCNCDEEGKFLYHRDKTKTDLPHHLNGHDVHLMQSTGLRDKNGDIYEGDVVQFKSPTSTHTNRVSYTDAGFRLGSIPLYIAVEQYEALVIGNIYENPELLNEKPQG
jgi:uncharacterized phage protein (TIGR01671 family)